MKTLAVRTALHNTNGLAVAQGLEAHPAVAQVPCPGLEQALASEIDGRPSTEVAH